MSIAFLRGVWKKKQTTNRSVVCSSAEPFTLSTIKNWDGSLYYSTDEVTWNEWDGTVIESGEYNGVQCLFLRGVGNSVITGSYDTTKYPRRWVLTGNNIEFGGNIENLLDYESVANGEHPTMGIGCYKLMFEYCTSLTTAPKLPATTLTESCYAGMFKGCTSLTTAPKLPATTLTELCYNGMFQFCSSLTTAPELPATTLALLCYNGMFADCTSLTTAPKLPATTLTESCYAGMFKGCTSLTTAPKLPATTLAVKCYYEMFKYCTSLTELPELPATTLQIYCYRHMFYDCTDIKLSTTQSDEYPNTYRIPTSGIGTIVPTSLHPLQDMFTGTGGTFTGTPEINTTYYTANTVV